MGGERSCLTVRRLGTSAQGQIGSRPFELTRSRGLATGSDGYFAEREDFPPRQDAPRRHCTVRRCCEEVVDIIAKLPSGGTEPSLAVADHVGGHSAGHPDVRGRG